MIVHVCYMASNVGDQCTVQCMHAYICTCVCMRTCTYAVYTLYYEFIVLWMLCVYVCIVL